MPAEKKSKKPPTKRARSKIEPRFIFVVGGVMSGVGKGVTTAAIGTILQSRGFRVTAMKIDPYINVDAGTMNPIEHGEVFVTEDGLETDQDLGNYERFLDRSLHRVNYMTTGAVYQSVINKERALKYNGKCVEVVPHIPEEVIHRIKRAAKADDAEIVLIEIGGTVGEYQNLLFLEAARMLKLRQPEHVCSIMVSFVPVPAKVGEMKTKPTQYAVRTLNSAGIQPDFIIARSSYPLDTPRKRKISTFCNLDEKDIISAPDISNIYDVPVNFERDSLGDRLIKKLDLPSRNRDLRNWRGFLRKVEKAQTPVRIGIVGKYFATGQFSLSDSYISVIEAIKHGAWANKLRPEIVWLNAENYEQKKENCKELSAFDGIIIPGGFGSRGTNGKLLAIEYCRKKNIPLLGICLGMQLIVVEYARNVARLKNAHSTELDEKTAFPVIDVMTEQANLIAEGELGGTMRLGNYTCKVMPGTLAEKAYRKQEIEERHRHRFEVNNSYIGKLERKGLVVSGLNPQRGLVEIVELPNHPFFLGTQFHPELTSRPLEPNPIFSAFLKAAGKNK